MIKTNIVSRNCYDKYIISFPISYRQYKPVQSGVIISFDLLVENRAYPH